MAEAVARKTRPPQFLFKPREKQKRSDERSAV